MDGDEREIKRICGCGSIHRNLLSRVMTFNKVDYDLYAAEPRAGDNTRMTMHVVCYG